MSDIMHVNIQFYIVKLLKKVQGSTLGFLTDSLKLFKQQFPTDLNKLLKTVGGILDAVKKSIFEVWSL